MDQQEYFEKLKTYTLSELKDVKTRIDGDKFPERYELILDEIKKREALEVRSECNEGLTHKEEVSNPYVGFWRRFGAYWIDVLILLPLMFLVIWGSDQARLFHLYYFIPGILFGAWYYVYLVKSYGGTPGKLILKIKISKLDFSPVGYKQAIIRYSVLFILTSLASIASIIVTLGLSDDVYFSMEYMERAEYSNAHMPGWYFLVSILMQVWIWSEFLVMLTNKKRRALHDFMAGTVVVHKEVSNKAN